MLVVAIALLVFLILFQASIRSGLLARFVGGIENQTAPILVEATDALGELRASSISPLLRDRIDAVPGVGATGAIGQVTVGARAGQKSLAISVVGFEKAELGAPRSLTAGRLPTSTGEVVANQGDAADGLDLGDTVTVLPGGAELTVVGQARDIDLGAPTVFATFETFTAALKASNPDARTPGANAIAVEPDGSVSASELTRRIDALTTDVDALTREEAAQKTPGVAQVKTSFFLIFVIFGVVIPLVTGLFFLIVTFQKANSLTLLRAIGGRSSSLVSALLIQVGIVMIAANVVAILLFWPLSGRRLGNITVRFAWGSVAFWALTLTVLGLLSSLVAARRVLAIDPLEATTGVGVGR